MSEYSSEEEMTEEEPMVEVNISMSLELGPFDINEVYEIDWCHFPTPEVLMKYRQLPVTPDFYQKYIIPRFVIRATDKEGHPDTIMFEAIKRAYPDVGTVQINVAIAEEMLESGTIKKSDDEYMKAKFQLLK